MQSVDAHPVETPGDAHVTHRPLKDYPEVMLIADVAAYLRVTVKHTYKLIAEGALDFALLKPRLGRPRFDRDRLDLYRRGELRGLTVVRRKRA
jgi:hypothetical protein